MARIKNPFPVWNWDAQNHRWVIRAFGHIIIPDNEIDRVAFDGCRICGCDESIGGPSIVEDGEKCGTCNSYPLNTKSFTDATDAEKRDVLRKLPNR